MSKAFTREDDDAGVSMREARSLVLPEGPFRITARGAAWLARAADPKLRALLARAEVLPAAPAPDRVALGVTVHTRRENGEERSYRIVTREEQAITGEGCSVESPVAQALLGARAGETREIRAPRGPSEIAIVSLEADGPPPAGALAGARA